MSLGPCVPFVIIIITMITIAVIIFNALRLGETKSRTETIPSQAYRP